MTKISKKQIILVPIEYSNDTYGDLLMKCKNETFKLFNIELYISFDYGIPKYDTFSIISSKQIIPIKDNLESINLKSIKLFSIHYLSDNENELEDIKLLINGIEEIVTWRIQDYAINSIDNNE